MFKLQLKVIKKNVPSLYLFKINNRSTRQRFEICLKLKPKKKQNDVNDVALVFLLLALGIFHTFF